MTAADNASPNELCRKCGTGRVQIVQVDSVFAEKDVRVSYLDEFSKCENCGDEFYTKEQSMSRSRAITSAIRKSEGLLTGDEIRTIRGKLGLTLPEFERAMCVGQKTIGRWERGTVPPSGPANVALWLAAEYPDLFWEWARTRGVRPKKRPARAADVTGSMSTTSQSPTNLTLYDGGAARAPRTASGRIDAIHERISERDAVALMTAGTPV
jgi:putative zinc finger/helix-turn-helix YgiT family protein